MPSASRSLIHYAKMDPTFALACIFRPLPRRCDRRQRLDVTYRMSDEDSLQVMAPYLLGIDDQSVLLALVAMAGPEGHALAPEPVGLSGQTLRAALAESEPRDTTLVRCSLHAICRLMGLAPSGGKRGTCLAVQGCLDRLAAVTLIVQSGRTRWTTHLLSYHRDPDGKLAVALNAQISQAIRGKAHHVRIDLAERAQLKGPTAQALHYRLCAWLRPGRKGKVHVTKLTMRVWGEDEQRKDPVARKRLQRVREALEQIRALPGWSVDVTNGLLTVFRTPQSP